MTTVVRKEIRQRSFAGKLIKWTFIGFNGLMIIWMVGGMSAVSEIRTDSAAEQVGHAIGATIGFSLILGIWAMGDIILGLLVLMTRGDKIIIEEMSGGARASGYTPKPTGIAMNADEMIARYMQREAVKPVGVGATNSSHAGGFGRRR